MATLNEILSTYKSVSGELLQITSTEATSYVIVNPRALRVEVAAGVSARLTVLYAEGVTASLAYELSEGAQLEVVEVFTAETFAEVSVSQQAHSRCRIVTLQVSSANAFYAVDLAGADADSELHGLFLAAAGERCEMRLRTNHHVADCRSSSYVKGVAAGDGAGEFIGRVYVAPDAQRTDARQQSRNILLGEAARITARPELEIYADDVKCSHGATVGQMDSDAILYMRQRGLSESQARRLQIEGFAADVVMHSSDAVLADALMAMVAAKLEKM